MKKIDENLYKKQKLEIFTFNINNIKELTIDFIFSIIELKCFSLKIDISEEIFLNHLLSIGFIKSKTEDYFLKFKDDNKFIELSYWLVAPFQNNMDIKIKKITTNTQSLEFISEGNLVYRNYNKKIKRNLLEKCAHIQYEVKTINSVNVEFVSSITYIYDDNRKNRIENLKLHSIVEYPIEVDNFTVSVFDPIYYNYISNQFFKTSQLILNFNGKDLKLFNPSSEHRHNLIDFNQIFSNKEIDLLKIIMFQ